MATGSSIGTRNAARTAITDADIIVIDDIEFSGETARRWKHAIVTAAKNVPTKIAGAAGAHGHTYIVESDAAFSTRSGGTAPAPADNPGALSYSIGVAEANRATTMAQEREDHGVALEIFHTQEGVTIGLRKVIIDSVPKELIVELEDEDTFFDEVEPRDLIAAVMGSATPDTTLESMELIKLRDAPLVFDTEEKLSLQLKKRAKHIKDLRSVHKIQTSETELMAKWLRSIQEDGGEDFEDEAAEWKAKTVANSFTDFKRFFIDRDLVVRDRDKHRKTKAKDAGFHSANNIRELEDRLNETMASAFKELAVATEETINLAVGTKPAPSPPSAAESSSEKLAEALRQLTKEVADLKQSRRARGGGGGGGGGGGDNATNKKNEKAKCKHCGRPHLERIPEDNCYELEKNAGNVPEWYKKQKARAEEKAARRK